VRILRLAGRVVVLAPVRIRERVVGFLDALEGGAITAFVRVMLLRFQAIGLADRVGVGRALEAELGVEVAHAFSLAYPCRSRA
jgi:hypothetical protein